MKVNVQYAETHLADLISAASRGEIVEIDAADASAQIYASPKPAVATGNGSSTPSEMNLLTEEPKWRYPEISRAAMFGCAKGKIVLADDWDSPETNAEIADLFENATLFPDATEN
jgi:antitoxin (DNA-binding transcriptional repressor) of toxin-antitoxin stability system